AHDDLFSKVNIVESGVNLLYIRETLWVENKLLEPIPKKDVDARNYGASMKSLLAYHETLSGMGVQANVKEIGEFNFTSSDYTGISIILAHQVALPSRYWKALETFVAKGGQLFVEGLSAFYDENAVSLMRNTFPFTDMFGGEISEFRFVDNKFSFSFSANDLHLTSHAWLGFIDKKSGEILSTLDGKTTALRNTYGKGKVVWIPTLIGLGARQDNDYTKLAELLPHLLPLDETIHFTEFHDLVLMKTIRADGKLISVIINKNQNTQTVSIKGLRSFQKGELLLSNSETTNTTDSSQNIMIKPEETLVIHWK